MIPPARGAAFVASLPVSRFHGVGPVTAARMERLGIRTGADLRDRPLEVLQAHFGKSATYLYGAARGEDDRPVRAHRVAKSIGAERTFGQDVTEPDAIFAALDHVANAAWERIARNGARGRTVTLKVRFADFRTITRARSIHGWFADREAFLTAGTEMLGALLPLPMGIRLLGLTLSAILRDEEGDGAVAQPALPLL